jgi:hypothetical protein
MSLTTPESGSDQHKKQPVSEETLLKISKEIAVKFIEMGRLTPATFDQTFKSIHITIQEAANLK